MKILPEELVLIYHAGVVTSLVRSTRHTSSMYGGPLDRKVTGLPLPLPLHHIATIGQSQLGGLNISQYLPDIPLVYGLSYSGCLLEYTYKHRDIEVLSKNIGEPDVDWPYAGYPQLLPYVPLEVGSTKPESWDQFIERAPNMSGIPSGELVVMIPPPATLGFSMWGPTGDAEDVTIVFECALEKQHVIAYNVCG